MGEGPPDKTEGGQREPIQDVYEQYWWHARHVEDQIWSYTRIWAVILTGIFTVVGSDLPSLSKAAAAGFGALLSVLGVFVVYSLRVPFLAFALRTELIALDGFELDTRYGRFFEEDDDFREQKTIDLPDVLLLVYGLVGTVLSYIAMYMLGYPVVGVAASVAIGALVVVFYAKHIVPEWRTERREAHDIAQANFDD